MNHGRQRLSNGIAIRATQNGHFAKRIKRVKGSMLLLGCNRKTIIITLFHCDQQELTNKLTNTYHALNLKALRQLLACSIMTSYTLLA